MNFFAPKTRKIKAYPNLSRRPFLDNLTVFMLVGSGRYLYHILTVSDFGLDFGSDVSQDVVLDGTRENLAIIKIMQFKRFEAKFAVKRKTITIWIRYIHIVDVRKKKLLEPRNPRSSAHIHFHQDSDPTTLKPLWSLKANSKAWIYWNI